MTQIASVDYDNKRAYLHLDTVVNGFDVIAAYFEINGLRAAHASGEQFRNHFISAEGKLPKGSGKFTPRYGFLFSGWFFVPYDTGSGTDYDLDLLVEIVSEDEVTDRDTFDRSSILCDVDIDAVYDQNEIITINTNPWEIPKPATPTAGTWGAFVGTRLLTLLNFLGYK